MAARLVERGDQHFTCYALDEAGGTQAMCDKYKATFAPRGADCSSSWFANLPGEERQECRVLALCFMAAMVEAGDA
jgi:hypothetical protein